MPRCCPTIAPLMIAGALLVCGCGSGDQSGQAYPRRPIKLIVPFAAGGGSDTFGRIVQNAIEKHGLLPQPLVVINVPGAGGTIGSRRVKNAEPDGYTLLLLHEAMMTARHSGRATYGPEAFAPIAGTGNATQVIAVREDSRLDDLGSLLRDAREQPESIVFSANLGAPSHFAGLMLEAASPGAAFRYTQTGGGAKRFAALKGGHVDVSAFSIAEYVQFRGSGLRALALLGPERHPELPELATAREQGFDVISQNMQFWWAPRGTPADRRRVIAEAVTAAMRTEQVQRRLAEMRLSDEVLVGAELARDLERRDRRLAAVATAPKTRLPDFAAWSFALLMVTGIVAAVQAWRRSRAGRAPTASSSRDSAAGNDRSGTLAWTLAAATVAYVMLLQWTPLGFRTLTAVYVLATGAVLLRGSAPLTPPRRTRVAVTLVLAALLMSVVLHALLTDVLVVDLP